MINFSNSVRIERPVGEVFSYLSDLEHIPEWNWAISETKKITPGPATVGSRYRQARSVPRPAIEILEITQLDPVERIEISGVLAQMPARLTYALNERGAETELTNTVYLEPDGPLRLAAHVISRRIERAVASNLVDLKTHLEAGNSHKHQRSNRP